MAKTQKPLRDLVPEIVTHFEDYRSFLEYNYRIFKVLEGQLREEVEASLAREIISQAAYNRIIERIPSINLLRKATDKLSKVYIEPPNRLTNKKSDQATMSEIVRTSHFDSVMNDANRIYNAQNAFAIEPFVQDGEHHFRVLAAHQFLPFSDNPKNPQQMTVFIKMLGSEEKTVGPEYDSNGNRVNDENQVYDVSILGLYSDDEILIIDTDGVVREDKMIEMGLSSTKNPFGRIPFIYGSKSRFSLIPAPNQEGLDIAILIPKLISDLNYAAQYMSHSIIWAKNTDLNGQEINPDAVVLLGDKDGDGGEPEIGTIDPRVDIVQIIGLAEFEAKSYFSCIGIKTESNEQMSNGRDASGIAKAIDEGDTTAERKVQIEFFKAIEMQMWQLMETVQNVWAQNNLVTVNAKFSTTFAETFRIKYPEVKPLKSTKQKLEEIQLMRDQKLMTRRQALRELNPDYSDEQLDEWIKELEKEDEEMMEKMLDAGGGMGVERDAGGQFNEGNQAATDQDPNSDKTEQK